MRQLLNQGMSYSANQDLDSKLLPIKIFLSQQFNNKYCPQKMLGEIYQETFKIIIIKLTLKLNNSEHVMPQGYILNYKIT